MAHYPLLLHGDALDILPTLMAGTVDVVVTDPPAGIGFMHSVEAGRTWDSFAGYESRTRAGEVRQQTLSLLGLKPWEAGFVAFLADLWSEVDRVLKPGGFVCSWALPKTADLAGLAMRLTGWTIHESVLHLFGSGMNKAGCIGKQIDKMHGATREVVGSKAGQPGYSLASSKGASVYQGGIGGTGDPERECEVTAPATDDAKRWTGWHSQIAPGHEQWLIARKPSKLTYAKQLLEHGCGAFNVGATRVPRGEADRERSTASVTQGSGLGRGDVYGDAHPEHTKYSMAATGSHPRNVVLSAGGPGCPVKGLDRQTVGAWNGQTRNVNRFSSRETGAPTYGPGIHEGSTGQLYEGDGSGASRYFTRFDQRVGYFPKASDRRVPGRPDLRNEHPTHKNPDLMRWLVRLMAATAEHTGDKPAVVLDPCMGSGTTGWACSAEGVRFIGIERDPAHFEVARARILGASGSVEEAQRGNEASASGDQLGLL